jgi:hypothetical protein
MTDAGPKKPGTPGVGGTSRGGAALHTVKQPPAGDGTGRGGPVTERISRDLSHDFRTPLNIIIGFSELLLEEIPGQLNEEQRLDLTDILDSGRRLLGLVNAMLERFEGGAPQTP